MPVRSIRPKGDKETRAIPATAKMEGGLVYFPDGGVRWWDEFKTELLGFPQAAHDDQVDCFSYAVMVARKIRRMTGQVEYSYAGAGDYSTGGSKKPRGRTVRRASSPPGPSR